MASSTLYTPIHDWQTRILAVHPAIYDQPIRIGLHIVDIVKSEGVVIHDSQKQIQYSALSYCWGSSKFDCSVSCNDVVVPVTSNLYAAIQRVRSQDRMIYLWVDAVCINQSDDDERSRQVREMVSIYGKAEQVIVWLGEPATEATMSKLIEQTAQLQMQIRRAERPGIISTEEWLAEKTTSLVDKWLIFASNPYFKRIWVKQEVWAARKAIVYIGPDTIPWKALYNHMQQAIELDWRRNPMDKSRHQSISHILTGFRRASWQSNLPWPVEDIFSLIKLSVGCLCTDARDHVFGLAGMATDLIPRPEFEQSSSPISQDRHRYLVTQSLLAVDYRRNVSQVFEGLTRYRIMQDKSLEMFSRNATFGSTVSGLSLPSWVLDWRAEHGPKSLSRWHQRKLEEKEVQQIMDSPDGLLNVQVCILGKLVAFSKIAQNDSEVLATMECVLAERHVRTFVMGGHKGKPEKSFWDRLLHRSGRMSDEYLPWHLVVPHFVQRDDVLATIYGCPGMVVLRPDNLRPRHRYLTHLENTMSTGMFHIRHIEMIVNGMQRWSGPYFESITLV